MAVQDMKNDSFKALQVIFWGSFMVENDEFPPFGRKVAVFLVIEEGFWRYRWVAQAMT